MGLGGAEAKLVLDAKIGEWRAALKKGLEAGALPPYEEVVVYTNIPTHDVKCALNYVTNLGKLDKPFRLNIKMVWSIAEVQH